MSDIRFTYEPWPDLELPRAAQPGRYPRRPDPLLDTARAIGRRVAATLFASGNLPATLMAFWEAHGHLDGGTEAGAS